MKEKTKLQLGIYLEFYLGISAYNQLITMKIENFYYKLLALAIGAILTLYLIYKIDHKNIVKLYKLEKVKT